MPDARSWLYVPADRGDRLQGAPRRGADALIVDLEDAVAPAGKAAARRTVAGWLEARPAGGGGPDIWVRLNADAVGDDVEVLTSQVAGVVLPKAEPALLASLDQALGAREQTLGVPAGQVAGFALVETAVGLRDLHQVATAARVVHVGLGEADLAAALRLRPSPDGAELAPLRLQVVVASAAAGIGAPVGPVSTDFRDLDGLRRSTEALRRQGFGGRTAIHPAQLPVINDVFTPSAEEVAEARELVEAFEAAGSGVITDSAGRMVDVAVVRSAREVLQRAARHAGAVRAAPGS